MDVNFNDLLIVAVTVVVPCKRLREFSIMCFYAHNLVPYIIRFLKEVEEKNPLVRCVLCQASQLGKIAKVTWQHSTSTTIFNECNLTLYPSRM